MLFGFILRDYSWWSAGNTLGCHDQTWSAACQASTLPAVLPFWSAIFVFATVLLSSLYVVVVIVVVVVCVFKSFTSVTSD